MIMVYCVLENYNAQNFLFRLVMYLNVECKKCKAELDANVDLISFDESDLDSKPTFDKNPECDKCGKLTVNDIYLTEVGQGQLTQIWMNA